MAAASADDTSLAAPVARNEMTPVKSGGGGGARRGGCMDFDENAPGTIPREKAICIGYSAFAAQVAVFLIVLLSTTLSGRYVSIPGQSACIIRNKVTEEIDGTVITSAGVHVASFPSAEALCIPTSTLELRFVDPADTDIVTVEHEIPCRTGKGTMVTVRGSVFIRIDPTRAGDIIRRIGVEQSAIKSFFAEPVRSILRGVVANTTMTRLLTQEGMLELEGNVASNVSVAYRTRWGVDVSRVSLQPIELPPTLAYEYNLVSTLDAQFASALAERSSQLAQLEQRNLTLEAQLRELNATQLLEAGTARRAALLDREDQIAERNANIASRRVQEETRRRVALIEVRENLGTARAEALAASAEANLTARETVLEAQNERDRRVRQAENNVTALADPSLDARAELVRQEQVNARNASIASLRLQEQTRRSVALIDALQELVSANASAKANSSEAELQALTLQLDAQNEAAIRNAAAANKLATAQEELLVRIALQDTLDAAANGTRLASAAAAEARTQLVQAQAAWAARVAAAQENATMARLVLPEEVATQLLVQLSTAGVPADDVATTAIGMELRTSAAYLAAGNGTIMFTGGDQVATWVGGEDGLAAPLAVRRLDTQVEAGA